MKLKDAELDKKTKLRISRLAKQGYPNPIERASFEKLKLSELEKLLYIASQVRKRRLLGKESIIKTNPVTIRIRNMKDAFNFSTEMIEQAAYMESLNSGVVGEGVLIAAYSKIPIEKLDIEILELNKEIKREISYGYAQGGINKIA